MTQLPFSWLRWLSAIALISSIALSQGCGGDVGCGSDSNRVREEGTDLCLCREGTVEDPDTLQCNEVDAGTDAGTDGCVETTYYRDMDGDERGDPDMSVVACEAPEGFVEDNTDCDDDCNVCWTGAEEVCDEEDNDCDGFSDEGVTVPVGDRIAVSDSLAGEVRDRFTLESLDNGSVLVFFIDDSLPRSNGVARSVRFETDGSIGASEVVDPETAESQSHIASARIGDRVFVAFSVGSRLRARAYSGSTGAPVTPPTWMNDEGDGGAFTAISGLGTFVLFAYEGRDALHFVGSSAGLGSIGPPETVSSFAESSFRRPVRWVSEPGDPDIRWLFAADTVEGESGIYGSRIDFLAEEISDRQLVQETFAIEDFSVLEIGAERLLLRGDRTEDTGFAAIETLSLSSTGVTITDQTTLDPVEGAYFGLTGVADGNALRIIGNRLATEAGVFVYTNATGDWVSTLVEPTIGSYFPMLGSPRAAFFDATDSEGNTRVFARRLGCRD